MVTLRYVLCSVKINQEFINSYATDRNIYVLSYFIIFTNTNQIMLELFLRDNYTNLKWDIIDLPDALFCIQTLHLGQNCMYIFGL